MCELLLKYGAKFTDNMLTSVNFDTKFMRLFNDKYANNKSIDSFI